LFGWPWADDCDQGCCATSFLGRRARAGSKPDRTGACSERIGEIRQAGAAQCSRGARDGRARGKACACGNTIDRCGDGQIDWSGNSQQTRGPALARCQRQHGSGSAGSSASQEQRTKTKRSQISPEPKSRGLALPTGRRGRSFKVIGPLAEVQFVDRYDLLLGFRHLA
jgi:hypothetical protein